MKKASQKKPQPIAPLRPIGVTLSQEEVDILTELTEEQSTLTGRTISSSALIRGLLRFASAFSGHLLENNERFMRWTAEVSIDSLHQFSPGQQTSRFHHGSL